MKNLTYIVVFLTLLLSGVQARSQSPFTNRPDIIRPLLQEFQKEAMDRGIDIQDRLKKVDSILLISQPENRDMKPSLAGFKSDGITWTRGHQIWIELKTSRMEGRPGEQMRLFLHEIGHAMGLDDCCRCTYNIMRCQSNDRADFLFGDYDLARIYIDEFFEAVRNPKKWNEGHTHY